MSEIDRQDYANFLFEVKQQIRDRQLQAMRSVNRELVGLYWAALDDEDLDPSVYRSIEPA